MANILETYNHSIQQALANTNNAASLVMDSHKSAMQNNTNTLNAFNEVLRESERNAIEREKNDIANNQAIDNSFQQNSFTRMLAYKDSGMSDKAVQEQMDKDLQKHREQSGYKNNPKHYSLAEMAIGGLAFGAKAGFDKLKNLAQKQIESSSPSQGTQISNTQSTPQTLNNDIKQGMKRSNLSQQINNAYKTQIPKNDNFSHSLQGSSLQNLSPYAKINLSTLNNKGN